MQKCLSSNVATCSRYQDLSHNFQLSFWHLAAFLHLLVQMLWIGEEMRILIFGGGTRQTDTRQFASYSRFYPPLPARIFASIDAQKYLNRQVHIMHLSWRIR